MTTDKIRWGSTMNHADFIFELKKHIGFGEDGLLRFKVKEKVITMESLSSTNDLISSKINLYRLLIEMNPEDMSDAEINEMYELSKDKDIQNKLQK